MLAPDASERAPRKATAPSPAPDDQRTPSAAPVDPTPPSPTQPTTPPGGDAPAPVAPAPEQQTARPFRADSSWNSPVPVTTRWRDEPKLRGDHWWVAREEYSFPIVRSGPSDPLVAVAARGSWGWPDATLSVHIPAGTSGAAGGDGSIVVIDGGAVYSFWQFVRTDASHATAVAYGKADLTNDTGWGSADPFLGAGIRAAGSSSLAGLITGDELEGAVIPHALAVSMPGTLLASGFVAPAISGDGAGGGSIPEGTRIGIPAGTLRPDGLSPAESRSGTRS